MIKLEIQAETIPELVKQVQELAKNFNLENASRTTIVKPKIEVREKETPTTDDCRLAYIDATHAGVSKEKVKEILSELKVERITAIPEEKRETFINKVKALVKE